MKISQLSALDLTEKEAAVYAALLEMRRASAPRLAKRTYLPKSTVYEMLKKLLHKELAKEFLVKKRRQYVATDPAIFAQKIDQRRESLSRILPELQALFGVGVSERPGIRFYEGKDGVHVVLKEALQEADAIMSVSSLEDIFTKLSEYFPKFSHERAKRGIPIRIISRDSSIARGRQKSGEKELRHVRLKKTTINYRCALFAWKNKVVLITLQEELSILVIESKDVFQMFSAMFEWLWASNTSNKI